MNRINDNLIHFGPNEELIRSFTSASVEFVVIGGLAVAWYCIDRQADDMDLMINPTIQNSHRVAAALGSLGLVGFSPEAFVASGLQVSIKSRHYADLLTPRSDAPTYADTAKKAVGGKLFGFPVFIASIACLIAMKREAAVKDPLSARKHLDDIIGLKHLD